MPSSYTLKNGRRSNGDQKFRPDPKKYLYNVDTFWYNCRSYYYQETMDNGLRDRLVAGRNVKADSSFDDGLIIKIDMPSYKNPVEFEIMHGNPPAYQYSIRSESMAVYLRKNDKQGVSHMRVQLNQFLLWDKGFLGAYEESLEVLKCLGFLPYDKKVNRIDLAVHSDQFDWRLDDLKKFDYPRNFADDNFPTFNRLNPATGEFGTVYYGARERLLLRIYNKSKEIKDNGKFYFNEIYEKHDMDINNIWNFEIEVRRPYLKDLKEADEETKDFNNIFDDLDVFLKGDGLSRLWSHLMSKYHHDSAHFTVLKAGDAGKFKNLNNYNLQIEKDIDANFEREKNQIAGRLMMGVMYDDDYSLNNAIEVFKKSYLGDNELEKQIEFMDKVENKKSKILSAKVNKSIHKQKRIVENYFEKLSADINKDKTMNRNEKFLIENDTFKNQNEKSPNGGREDS